jgi:hypothetical protein
MAADTAQRVEHAGVVCDGCRASPIVGLRITCLYCPCADFCAACSRTHQRQTQHPTISFARPLAEGWSVQSRTPFSHVAKFPLLSSLIPLSLVAPIFTESLARAPPAKTAERAHLASVLFLSALAAPPGSAELSALVSAAEACRAGASAVLEDAWRRTPAVSAAPPPLDGRFWRSAGT